MAREATAPVRAPRGVPRLRWWFVSIPLLLIVIIGQVDKVSISIVIANKKFLQDMLLVGRPAVTGLLMSGFFVFYATSQFFWGYVVRKFGPRASAICGLVMWGGTLVLSGAAHTVGALITARCLLGIGEGFLFPVANTFVANWFPLKERGRANAVWLNGMTISQVLSGALVVGVIAMGGWRMVFYTLAGLSILIPLPLVIFLMKDKPRQHSRISDEETTLIEEGSWAKSKEIPKTGVKGSGIFGNYRFWLITAAWCGHGMFFYGWTTWMPTYFQNARHFRFQTAGYVYSFSFLFVLLAIFLVAYCSDRLMRRAPFAAGGFLVGGILIYVGGNLVVNPYSALAVLIVALCCIQPSFTMLQSLLQSILPEGSIGVATGVAASISSFAAAVAPTLAGFLLQVSGFGAVIIYLAGSAFAAGVIAVILAAEGY
ncbi:MAG TPA: MFS transporter [Syntrophorhabdales bacterium]|nr:MFS transporter [Syntrophorhabdales bacterium]